MATATTQTSKTRKTPPVGNTTSKRKSTKTVTIKKDVTKTASSTRSTAKTSKTASRSSKTLSTEKLEKRVDELEATLTNLIKVLNEEFRSEMLQGPRGVSRSLSKAGLLKDI